MKELPETYITKINMKSLYYIQKSKYSTQSPAIFKENNQGNRKTIPNNHKEILKTQK